MFGKRGNDGFSKKPAAPVPASPPAATSAAAGSATAVATKSGPEVLSDPVREGASAPRQQMTPPPLQPSAAGAQSRRRQTTRDEGYYDTKMQVFSALIDTGRSPSA